MDDIKRRKKIVPQQEPPFRSNEGKSAIEAVWEASSQEAEKSRFKQKKTAPKWLLAILFAFFVGAVGVGVSIYVYKSSSTDGIDTSVIDRESSTDSAVTVLLDTEEVGGIFDSTTYYGVFTSEGSLYFGHITESTDQFYRLQDVFYKKGRMQIDRNADVSSGDGSSEEGMDEEYEKKILGAREGENISVTLVKLGTEAFHPEDKLILPREQVRQIFPLSDDSPILMSILNYYENKK